jgi:hypothetical protein
MHVAPVKAWSGLRWERQLVTVDLRPLLIWPEGRGRTALMTRVLRLTLLAPHIVEESWRIGILRT